MDDFRADATRAIEEERDLTEHEVRAIVRDEYAKVEAERAALPVSDWANIKLQLARARGITNGSRPQSYATHKEVALMVNFVK